MHVNLDPVAWQLWCLMALSMLLVVALESDLRERRVPNVLVALSLVAGVTLHAAGPVALGGGVLTSTPGALGVTGSLFGALAGLVIFLPLYMLNAMGAGDVKLMAAVGSIVGPAEAISLALCILVAGGALAILRMLWIRKVGLVLTNVKKVLQCWSMGIPHDFDPVTQTADRMPYVLAVAAGCLCYGGWRLTGGAALIG